MRAFSFRTCLACVIGLFTVFIPTQAQNQPAGSALTEDSWKPSGPFPPDFGIPRAIPASKTRTKAAVEGFVNAAPQIASVRTSSSSGRAVLLSLVANDADGARDLESIYVIVQSTLSPRNACFVHYRVDSDRYQLANNDATAWVSPGIPAGSPQLQSNSQCTLDNSFGGAGTNEAVDFRESAIGLSISFGLQFTGAFEGPKKIYAYAIDRAKAEAQWQEYAGFQVSAATAPEITGPKSVTFTGVGQTGADVDAQFGIRSAQGVSSIATVFIIVNSVLSSANSCLIELDVPGQRYRLANNAGTDWLPWFSMASAPAQAPGTSNARCTPAPRLQTNRLHPLQASIAVSAAYQDALSSQVTVYANVIDFAGQASGWNEVGRATWVVENRIRAVPQIQPQSQNATSRSTTAVRVLRMAAIGSKNEVAPRLAYALIGRQSTLALDALTETCLAEFDRVTGEFRLATDDRTAWLPTAARLGSETILENSNCSLHAKYGEGLVEPSASLPSARALRVGFPIAIKSSLASNVNSYLQVLQSKIYVKAIDPDGLSSTWEKLNLTLTDSFLQASSLQWGSLAIEGNQHTFSVEMSLADGTQAPPPLLLNLHAEKSSRNGCQIEIRKQSGIFQGYLRNDSGTANLATALGQPGVNEVANSQCAISSLTVNDLSIGSLRYVVKVRFLGSYGIPESVYASAPGANFSTGWVRRTLRLLPGSFPQLSKMVPAVLTSIPSPIKDANSATFLAWHAGGVRKLKLLRLQFEDVAAPFTTCTQLLDLQTGQTSGCQAATLSLYIGNRRIPNQFALIDGMPENSARIQIALEGATTKRILGEVEDIDGLSSGSKELGLNKGSQGAIVSVVAAPREEAWDFRGAKSLPEFEPETGDMSISLKLFHNNLFRLRNVFVLINSTLSNAGGCLIWLSLPAAEVKLSSVDGTTWLPGAQPITFLGAQFQRALPLFNLATLPSSTRMTNENCFTFSGGAVRQDLDQVRYLKLYTGFRSPMAGMKQVYVYADDVNGNSTGWLEMWKMNILGQNRPPHFVEQENFSLVLPIPGTRTEGTSVEVFERLADPNGMHDLRKIEFAVGTSPTDSGACRGEFDFSTGTIALYNNSGSALGTAVTWTAATLPANSLCAIESLFGSPRGFDFDYVRGGSGVSIGLRLKLSQMPDDTYGVYVRGTDAAGLTTGWSLRSTHTKRPAAGPRFVYPPKTSSAATILLGGPNGTPNSWSGSLIWTEGGNPDNTANLYFIIRSGTTTANACFVNFDRNANVLRLAADSGNAWLPSTPTPGTGLALANSQCRITAIRFAPASPFLSPISAVSRVDFDLEFLPGFAGYKSFEAFVENKDGANSGWQVIDFLDIRP